MNLWEEMEKDGDELLRELGRIVIYREKQVIAMVDPNPMDQAMAVGGFHIQSSFRVKFLAKKNSELRNNPPKHGEQMSVYDLPYTIISIINRPPSPWIECIVQQTD